MSRTTNERFLDPDEWTRIGKSLHHVIGILDGTATPVGRGVGRWSQMLIENAEAFEHLAALMRQAERDLLEKSLRK